MKKHAFICCMPFLLVLLSFGMGPQLKAQSKDSKMKIGIYDSRMVVFAWSRSAFFKDRMNTIRMKSDSANQAKDSVKFREISIQAMSFQHLLHQMVFSTGSVALCMDCVKNDLPALAQKMGVVAIVSKYEIPYLDPSVEKVDLTKEICSLFKPTEDISSMLKQIGNASPIPIDKLGIEEEMLKGYCVRFGEK